MSALPPDPPPDRQPVTRRMPPVVPEPAVPAASAPPPAVTPAGSPAAAVPPAWAPPGPTPPPRSRVVLRAGPFWGGAFATALVAALVGVVGVLVLQSILDVDLVVKDPAGVENDYLAYALAGFVAAIAAAALLHLLVVSTPRPRAFFGWILALGIVVAALLPLTWTDDTTSALCTGLVNLLIGVAIWSLLSGVLARTTAVVTT
ncbi:MAG: DUF6069 family protein [Cellulomonas sp.]|nr:DUF6069 family protein [Cellulomonas sp.]MCR6646777.1 DUF6069 family protein [Cellulomonas sp.]